MCFFKKAPKHWPMAMFGLIAVGIIVSTAILLKIVYNAAMYDKRLVSGATQTTGPDFVLDKYLSELQDLREELGAVETKEEIFAAVEKGFFVLRVPQENLSEHILAFFQIMKLKETGDLAQVKEQVLSALGDLMSKARNTGQ